ncbi:hypothetical protein [Plantactinospora endophytica]|uniref:hypothetical protein n=1 Tax=Plantactinospora endophytica TaxID=673535 RepID=UPI003636B631
MPVRALHQQLWGVCRRTAHPGTAVPDRADPGAGTATIAARSRRPVPRPRLAGEVQ